MKEEEKNKQIWRIPEIYDLDVEKTAGGILPAYNETSTAVGVYS
jgi:hypothetical protein